MRLPIRGSVPEGAGAAPPAPGTGVPKSSFRSLLGIVPGGPDPCASPRDRLRLAGLPQSIAHGWTRGGGGPDFEDGPKKNPGGREPPGVRSSEVTSVGDDDLHPPVLGLVAGVLRLVLAVGLADHVVGVDLALLDQVVHDRVGALEGKLPVAVELRLG